MLEVNLPQLFINSVLTGSIYALVAMGLALTYSILKFANFAHAEFVTFGAYMAFVINVTLMRSLVWGILAAFILAGFLAIVTDLLFFKQLRKRGATTIPLMIASIGIGLVIRHSIQEIWGPIVNFYRLETIETLQFLTATLTDIEAWIIISAIAVVFAFHILLTYTKIGKAMRALSENPTLALASGINIERLILLVWFIGAGVAGIAGVLRGADTRLTPMMGWELLLPAFAVIVLGGLGSFYGAILASYILGFAENLAVLIFIELSIPTTYRLAVAFAILIIILLFKPTGLMGIKGGK